jgi:uncharacterized membrane protein YfcA
MGAVVFGVSVTVNYWFVLTLTCGAILGGFIGTSLSIKGGEVFVKKAFTVSCLTLGVLL